MDATRAKILESFLNTHFEAFESHIRSLGDDEPVRTAESIVQEIGFQALQAQYVMRSQPREIVAGGFSFFREDWWYHAPQLERWRGHTVEVHYNDQVDALWVILPDGRPARVIRYERAAESEAA